MSKNLKKTFADDIFKFAKKYFPYHRSITGEGVRLSLKLIKQIIPKIKIKSFKSGKKIFDWKVPLEWKIKEAYIVTPTKKKICDIKKNNLHLVSYSIPINKYFDLEELKKHLFFLPKLPNAIPYVTSYYKKFWGFCIKYSQFKKLRQGKYRVYINSKFTRGVMNYGELLIKGSLKKEILLSTYICHPSMANNETSGPTVQTFIAKWLLEKKRKFSYRIVFVPETIGSIAYINKNLKLLKKNVHAGFIINCLGDEKNYSYLPSRKGNTISDKVALHILNNFHKNFRKYEWKDRASDERQYCSPGVDLPIATIMKTRYGDYKEYHTSLDNFKNVVSKKGLCDGFEVMKKTILALENNFFPKSVYICEPFLSKRQLYPTSLVGNPEKHLFYLNEILTWSDGEHSLIDIANKLNVSIFEIQSAVTILLKRKLIKIYKKY